MTETIVKEIVRYSSYTEAQKRATKKYRENNKEKVNERRKLYYQQRKEKDPSFLEYKRTKAREYYHRKKAMKKPTVNEVIEILNLTLDQPETKPQEVKEVVITPEPVIEDKVEPKEAPKKEPTRKKYKWRVITDHLTEKEAPKVEEPVKEEKVIPPPPPRPVLKRSRKVKA